MLLTIIITILAVLIVEFLFVKVLSPIVENIFDKAIDVACYVNTYHYDKEEVERIRIGQERFYSSLFDKEKHSRRDMTNFVFWIIYTQIINKPLRTIPVEVNMYNNRCLADGEYRCSGQYLDKYQDMMLDELEEYSTCAEKQNRHDCENISCECEENSDG